MVRKIRFEGGQASLSGSLVTEEQWKAQLEAVEDYPTSCPFCLSEQNLHSMCYANKDGSLSDMRRCQKCGRAMLATSAVVILRGEKAYGEFVATYPGFWNSVGHESFMNALDIYKKTHPQWKYWEFWKAYRAIRPKPKLDKDGYVMRDSDNNIIYEGQEDKEEKEWEKLRNEPDTISEPEPISEPKNELESEKDFVFVSKTPELKGQEWVVTGTAIAVSEAQYVVKTGKTSRQKVKRLMWELKV